MGEHEVRISLLDNSGDTAAGKMENERTYIFRTEYVLSIIVSEVKMPQLEIPIVVLPEPDPQPVG